MPDTENQSSCFFISFFGTILKLPHDTCTEVLLPNSYLLKSSAFSGTSQKKALSAVQGLQGGLSAFLGCSLEWLPLLRIVIIRAGLEPSWYFAVARWLVRRHTHGCPSLTGDDAHEAGTCFVQIPPKGSCGWSNWSHLAHPTMFSNVLIES